MMFSMGVRAQLNFTSGLKGYFPMNGDYYNAQGNIENHNAFFNANFGSDSIGGTNLAGNFNGSTRVNMNEQLIDSVINFSVDFWFKTSASVNSVFFWEGVANQQSVWIRMESTNIKTSIGNTIQFNQTISNGNYHDGYWHHFALTASNGNTATAYIDGMVSATTSQAWATGVTTNFSRLGCKDDLTQYLNGNMDDLKVWDRPLSATEVMQIFQTPIINVGSLSNTTLCTGASALLTYTVTGGNFQANNNFYAQLSDANGSFKYPLNIGSVAATTSGTINLIIPDNVTTDGNYKIRIIATQHPKVSQNTLSLTINNPVSFSNYNINSDLHLYYPFDGNANDASGLGINGTISGGVTSDTGHTGLPNTAMRFNGSNGKIFVGNKYPIKQLENTFTPVSISTWIYQYTTPATFGYIFSTYSGVAADGLFFGSTAAGNIRFRINTNNNVQAPLANNQWVHVVATYDGTNTRLYINGQLAATAGTTGAVSINIPAEMGWDASGASNDFLNAKLDEFRFYTRMLTAEEALMLYRDGNMIANNSPICTGGTLQFDAPSYTPLTYNWTGPNSFSSTAEDPSVSPFSSFTNAGTYQCIFNLNGCVSLPFSSMVVAEVSNTAAVSGTTVCAGNPVLLTATGALGNQQYYWYSDPQGLNNVASNVSSYAYSPLTTDTIYVGLFDGTACYGMLSSAIVNINPLPAVPAISQNNYTLTSSPESSYQWYFNNTLINGATSQSYTVTQTGNYSVVVTDVNGCTNSSIALNVIVTGLEDIISFEDQILIYPNPSKEQFTVQAFNYNFDLVITDIFGRRIYENKNVVSQTRIDASRFQNGIYFIQATSEKSKYSKKIVIEH